MGQNNAVSNMGYSWDKALLGQAVLFNLAKDLKLTIVIGHDKNGTAITNNQRYSNCSWIFYIGYMG